MITADSLIHPFFFLGCLGAPRWTPRWWLLGGMLGEPLAGYAYEQSSTRESDTDKQLPDSFQLTSSLSPDGRFQRGALTLPRACPPVC